MYCNFLDGSRVAKSTPIEALLRSEFELVINDNRYPVIPPEPGTSHQ